MQWNQSKKRGPGIHIRLIWFTLGRYDRYIRWISLWIILLGVAVPYTEILLPKVATGLLLERADTRVIAWNLGGYALLAACLRAAYKYLLSQRTWRLSYVSQGTAHDLLSKSLSCHYEYSQEAGTLALYGRLRQMADSPSTNCYVRLLYAIADIASGLLGFAVYTAVLCRFDVRMVPLLIASSLAHFIVAHRTALYEHRIKDETAVVDKKLHYLFRVTVDASGGKDIRLYRAAPWLAKWFQKLDILRGEYDAKVENKRCAGQFVCSFIGFLRDGAAYVWLLWMVLHGAVPLDDFLLALGIVRGFSGFLLKALDGLVSFKSEALYLDDIVRYDDGGNVESPEEPVSLSGLKNPVGIEFRNLSYGYPNGVKIFDRFSLKIQPGEKIALVGLNGAGKTTLMDLLCGLRRPTEGQITLNGYDLRQFSQEDLFSLFGSVFQKNFILPASLAANIAPSSSADAEGIWRCLDRSGLGLELRKQNRGLDSPMTRVAYGDGLELSGGQRQKLYLARMLYKDSPIIILDEPTAALDPVAESQVYEQYVSLVGDCTAIFISHRLASTRFCDRILFLKDGVVIEEGSHDALMEKRGAYCEMFNVQSQYYKQQTAGEEADG